MDFYMASEEELDIPDEETEPDTGEEEDDEEEEEGEDDEDDDFEDPEGSN